MNQPSSGSLFLTNLSSAQTIFIGQTLARKMLFRLGITAFAGNVTRFGEVSHDSTGKMLRHLDQS
jgi:hypothetical protein